MPFRNPFNSPSKSPQNHKKPKLVTKPSAENNKLAVDSNVKKIEDEAEAEKYRRSLLELQAASAAVESTGQATAEAKARAQAQEIEGKGAVKLSERAAEAETIKGEAALLQKKASQDAALGHQKALDELEIAKAKDLAEIEAEKFKAIVDALGAKTLEAIAQAGPDMQAKLLSGLGLKSLMLTDTNSPLNIFSRQ